MFSFQQILNSSPQVKQYFTLYANSSNQCMKLATQLIKQSIARRKLDEKKTQTYNNKFNKKDNNIFIKKDNPLVQQQNSPKQSRTNHYNVAYIKHNRFLSPSQKKQVTPKVTEIIPISPQKVFIYGKPKVKLDHFHECEIHHNSGCYSGNQQYQREQNENTNDMQLAREEMQNQRQEFAERSQIQEENYHKKNMQIPYQYEEYLQPKSKKNKKKTFNKISKITQQQQQNKTVGAIVSPKSSKQTNTSQQHLTSPKSFITSPKSYIINPSSQQNYTNVQSKIKQLINRDKRNRQVQKQVQKQKQQIQQLQQRQKRLLLQQKEQQQEMLRQEMIRNERQREEQLWRIKNAYDTAYNNQMARLTRNNYIQQPQVQSQFTSSSQDSIVNLHGHRLEQSRVECYQCQIQRLRKRKQKAKQAIKEIQKQQAKRNQLLLEIAQNNTQQFYPQHLSMNKYHNVDQSYGNSLSIY